MNTYVACKVEQVLGNFKAIELMCSLLNPHEVYSKSPGSFQEPSLELKTTITDTLKAFAQELSNLEKELGRAATVVSFKEQAAKQGTEYKDTDLEDWGKRFERESKRKPTQEETAAQAKFLKSLRAHPSAILNPGIINLFNYINGHSKNNPTWKTKAEVNPLVVLYTETLSNSVLYVVKELIKNQLTATAGNIKLVTANLQNNDIRTMGEFAAIQSFLEWELCTPFAAPPNIILLDSEETNEVPTANKISIKIHQSNMYPYYDLLKNIFVKLVNEKIMNDQEYLNFMRPLIIQEAYVRGLLSEKKSEEQTLTLLGNLIKKDREDYNKYLQQYRDPSIPESDRTIDKSIGELLKILPLSETLPVPTAGRQVSKMAAKLQAAKQLNTTIQEQQQQVVAKKPHTPPFGEGANFNKVVEKQQQQQQVVANKPPTPKTPPYAPFPNSSIKLQNPDPKKWKEWTPPFVVGFSDSEIGKWELGPSNNIPYHNHIYSQYFPKNSRPANETEKVLYEFSPSTTPTVNINGKIIPYRYPSTFQQGDIVCVFRGPQKGKIGKISHFILKTYEGMELVTAFLHPSYDFQQQNPGVTYFIVQAGDIRHIKECIDEKILIPREEKKVYTPRTPNYEPEAPGQEFSENTKRKLVEYQTILGKLIVRTKNEPMNAYEKRIQEAWTSELAPQFAKFKYQPPSNIGLQQYSQILEPLDNKPFAQWVHTMKKKFGQGTSKTPATVQVQEQQQTKVLNSVLNAAEAKFFDPKTSSSQIPILRSVKEALEYGLALFTPSTMNTPYFEITQESLERTLRYIFEHLHHSCYMLCIKNNTAYIFKLESTGMSDIYKPIIEKELEEKKTKIPNLDQYRIMQCIIKPYKKESSTANEWLTFLHLMSITAGGPLKDGVFILNLTDALILKKDYTEPWNFWKGKEIPKLPAEYNGKKFLPIFSYSGHQEFVDIPIPTFDDIFEIKQSSDDIVQARIPGAVTNWSDKQVKAVFRGSSTGCGFRAETNQRLKLTSPEFIASLKNKDMLDVGITTRTKQLKMDPVYGLGQVNPKIPITSPMSLAEQSKAQALIHVDGNVHAYRLLTTMLTGSVILRVMSSYMSWVDVATEGIRGLNIANKDHLKKLQDGSQTFHYIIVKPDLSNLDSVLTFLKENSILCEKIASSGQKYAKERLQEESVQYSFIYRLMSWYNSGQWSGGGGKSKCTRRHRKNQKHRKTRTRK